MESNKYRIIPTRVERRMDNKRADAVPKTPECDMVAATPEGAVLGSASSGSSYDVSESTESKSTTRAKRK